MKKQNIKIASLLILCLLIMSSLGIYAAVNAAQSRTMSMDDNGSMTIPGIPYKSYQAVVSQSGTSAPTALEMNNDFTGTTFNWARTSAGTYTLTASSAVFTAGKTVLLLTDPSNALWAFRVTVTSSTVVTVNTSILSVITLILSITNTDSLLSNTLAEVRVYP